jgi:phenylpropionate dioxygenase-like ring-hydroxylating dioxygenase large terminal subunit
LKKSAQKTFAPREPGVSIVDGQKLRKVFWFFFSKKNFFLEGESMTFVSKQDVAHLGTGPIPTEPYFSEAQFEAERDKIYRKVWLFFARDSDLPNTGDYIVKDFDVADASVLATRNKEGKIQAFHNVCTHRASKLVWEPRGNSNGFSCRYHGWRYGINGEAKSIPDADSFFDLDIKKCGLAPIALEIWNGFIFINLDPHPAQTLAEFLGAAGPKLSQHPYEGFESFVIMGLTVDVNWKCILDNFQETYHLASVHRLSVADRSISNENPLAHPVSFDFYGPHRVMGVWGNPHHKPAMVESIAYKYGGVMSGGALQQKQEHKLIRHPNWQLDVHGIFPNLLIDVAPSFFFVHEFDPISASRTKWLTTLYLPKARTAGERFSQEYNVAAYRDTVAEDLAILRTQQKGMMSGAIKKFDFQLSESMCRHSYNAVNSYITAQQAAE